MKIVTDTMHPDNFTYRATCWCDTKLMFEGWERRESEDGFKYVLCPSCSTQIGQSEWERVNV